VADLEQDVVRADRGNRAFVDHDQTGLGVDRGAMARGKRHGRECDDP
jgi:hypothetical protein